MSIATWNVNSIRSRLTGPLAWAARERPDVLCLQEIKITDELFPPAPFEELGYNAETFGQKTYNGVAILSRKPLQRGGADLPGRRARRPAAAARLRRSEQGEAMINVYVPNGQSPTSDKFVYKLDWLVPPARDFLAATANPYDLLVLLRRLQHRARGVRRALPRPLAGPDPLPP